jgi:hypothetical protein
MARTPNPAVIEDDQGETTQAPNPAVIEDDQGETTQAPNPAVIEDDQGDTGEPSAPLDPYETVPCIATGKGLAEAGSITNQMRKDVPDMVARGLIEDPEPTHEDPSA